MALIPELKEIHIFTEEEVKGDFCLSLVLDIGPSGMFGSDQFYATIGTPQGFADFLKTRPFIVCRGFLVVDEYNLKAISMHIQDIITKCAKEDWEQTALSINKFFPWEFDEMKWK